MKKTIIIVGILIILVVVGSAPWLSKNKARQIVQKYPGFQIAHPAGSITENEIGVTWLPFCRWVTTHEGGWFVCFWENVR